jgi:predicted nucleic acid-binding protein
MMLLDTNVVSEMWRPRPDPRVNTWLNAQVSARLYICTPVLAEIRVGIERLPQGPRKTFLSGMSDRLIADGYRGRVLELDLAAAMEYGRITAHRERLGRRLELMDALIASIALVNRMTLVTRNISDFSDIGLDLIDPFAVAST